MPSKKILILSIIISLASHVAMLSLTGFIRMQEKSIKEDVLTVQLKEYQENIAGATEIKKTSNVLPLLLRKDRSTQGDQGRHG